MAVTVTKGAPLPTPAADGSPLIDLRRRREEKLNKLHIDLEVPRWGDNGGPAVWIRYRPAKMAITLTAAEKRQKSKHKDWFVLSNADVLVDSCVGVFVKVNGEPFTLAHDGTWTSFDPDTAAEADWVSVKGARVDELNDALGIQASSAVESLRALFFTDGDLFAHANALGDFSGVEIPKADEEAVGE